jgi:hypothetical protein
LSNVAPSNRTEAAGAVGFAVITEPTGGVLAVAGFPAAAKPTVATRLIAMVTAMRRR